jgi:hypothetical protein
MQSFRTSWIWARLSGLSSSMREAGRTTDPDSKKGLHGATPNRIIADDPYSNYRVDYSAWFNPTLLPHLLPTERELRQMSREDYLQLPLPLQRDIQGTFDISAAPEPHSSDEAGSTPQD